MAQPRVADVGLDLPSKGCPSPRGAMARNARPRGLLLVPLIPLVRLVLLVPLGPLATALRERRSPFAVG